MKINKLTLCIFCIFSIPIILFGQTIKITGKVTDKQSKEALIGASILDKDNPGKGTVTDITGLYTFEVEKNSVLTFSYIGYVSQEFVVKNDTTLDVQLSENVQVFDEIVVVGYGTQKRSEINGAVSVVLAEDINKTANLRIEQALQGRTSGVQITQSSGSPGNALSVRIRGVGTPNNSDPLYIVDGVWVDGIDFLNPNDIASISVLKDAASAAIYGTSGANGVVLITTKEGKTGKKGSVSFDSYYGVQQVARTVELFNAQQYGEYILEANPDNSFNIPDPQTLGEGTDWQNEIFQDAPIQSHQFTVLGSGEKSTYGIVGSYFQQEGIMGGEKSAFERYTARFKSTSQVNKALKILSNVNYTYLTRDALPENNEFSSPVAFAMNIDPITTVKKDDGTYNFSEIVTGDVKNPVNRIALSNSQWQSNRIIGSLGGELEILKGLTFKTMGSMDINFATNFSFQPFFNLDPTGAFVHESVLQNSVTKESQRWTNLMLENTLGYNFSIKENSKIEVLLGRTYRDRNWKLSTISLADLPSNDPEDAYITNQTVTEANEENRGIGEDISESTLLSYFGRVNYNLLDKYFVTASLRRDGSSRFGSANKFAVFPAASVGWLATEDIGFGNFLPSLNYLKLRASWGQNGNEASLGDYGYVSSINSALGYVFGTEQNILQGEAPTTPANSDLKWEVSTQTDIGFDAGFLQDKISFSMDYFIKDTKDLLIPAAILATAGSGVNDPAPPFQNIGTIRNKGWEFAVGYRTGRVLKSDIGFNISFINNEVTSLGQASTPYTSGYVQGIGNNTTRMEENKPLGYFYGYETDGIFQNVFEVRENLNADGEMIQPNAVPGDFRFKDLNGDGIISDSDQTQIGSPHPDFIYGLTGNFEFRNFDLSIFVQGSHGNEIVNATT